MSHTSGIIHHIWHYRVRLRESGQPIGRLRKTCKNAFPRTIPVSFGRLDTSRATESSLDVHFLNSHVNCNSRSKSKLEALSTEINYVTVRRAPYGGSINRPVNLSLKIPSWHLENLSIPAAVEPATLGLRSEHATFKLPEPLMCCSLNCELQGVKNESQQREDSMHFTVFFDKGENASQARRRNVDKITEIIEVDRHVSSRSIAQELKIDQKTVLNYLCKVGFKNKLDIWVPLQLTSKNMVDRISICEALAKRNEINLFLKQMRTGDDKWVTYDNIVRK
ncbi:histone-lysine N-methyltransferase SETMAR [Trichonephila clavipes]|nr:histone-lysine N-methyltransferase SETMAR [Trichonephila clavipes]